MARLVEAIRVLGLAAQVAPSGRWAELEGERCGVSVAAESGETAFYAWCDAPDERTVEYHADPAEAIRSGLRRAGRRDP